jgi:putative cardiolipin synthase
VGFSPTGPSRYFQASVLLTFPKRPSFPGAHKSFTADNQATVIGGRNVGDEYFDATEGVVFVDLDVLAIGPVVKEVSNDFDRYWASDSSYPVDRLLPPADSAQIDAVATAASRIEHDPPPRPI